VQGDWDRGLEVFSAERREREWLTVVDSGAAVHIANRRAKVSSVEDTRPVHVGGVDHRSRLVLNKKAAWEVGLTTGKTKRYEGALLHEECSTSLLSVPMLTQDGSQAIFGRRGGRIEGPPGKDGRREVLTEMVLVPGLGYVIGSPGTVAAMPVAASDVVHRAREGEKKLKGTAQFLHITLGHTAMRTVAALGKLGYVTVTEKKQFPCEGCMRGTMKVQPAPQRKHEEADERGNLEEIAVDSTGRQSTPAVGTGARYGIIFATVAHPCAGFRPRGGRVNS
jgi:hypothetical protein